MWQKCVKSSKTLPTMNLMICQFFDTFWAKMILKKTSTILQKCVKRHTFVSFLILFWKINWHILNTFLYFVTFLPDFGEFFDKFVSDLCFWQFFDTLFIQFWHIFVFWQIFDSFLTHFWHILEIMRPTLDKSTRLLCVLSRYHSRWRAVMVKDHLGELKIGPFGIWENWKLGPWAFGRVVDHMPWYINM